MAEKKINWTEQQRTAITARGSDIFVTASAGTGKTAVLSGRCVDVVSDKNLCPDVWSILVLTFTEAAAEQMRSRIGEQLRGASLQSPDRHLQRQLMLLQGADISTIHSFCKRLISEHFHKLGLDPTFGIIDGDEQRLLKAETVEKTLDWAWRQSNLVDGLGQLLSRRRLNASDGFVARIVALHNFLDGVVCREHWCDEAVRLCDAGPFPGELGQKQKRIVREKLQAILDRLQQCLGLYNNEASDGDWATKCRDNYIEPVEKCFDLLKNNDWEGAVAAIRNYAKPRWSKPKDVPGEIADLIKQAVKESVDAFEKLGALAIINPDYLDKVGGPATVQTRTVIELVRKFDELYSRAKQAINCLDFADLEHYALRLLSATNDSDDKPAASETAIALRRRYKFIFVDEYQDINPVQEAILERLSGEGNVFVVGDVKQSIYAFRGARPEFFLERLKSASADDESASGLRVDLNANFRSAKGILDFVNKVFARIMTASFTKIDYDESARLTPAPDKSEQPPAGSPEPIVEFHILDERARRSAQTPEDGGEEDSNLITSRQRQAAMIARRIKEMVGADGGKAQFEIYDPHRQRSRAVDYGDIVILMRSPSKRANDYVQVLQSAQIPVSSDASAGYFETTEITDMLCLLKVLDNPQRDIELAAVLRSPFFKLSDTDLAKIKVHGNASEQCRNFHDCLTSYSRCGPEAELIERLAAAISAIDRWRRVARRGDLGDLIWRVYRETGYLSFATALPNGSARRANLLKLHDRAIQFEGFGGGRGVASLTRFVNFIERLIEAGGDWAPAQAQTSGENAVRIMSVHKSKGLEFPVVFLAELDSAFNKSDTHEDVLADVDHSLGVRIIEKRSNSKLSSLAHQVIAERKMSEGLAEEMRILYVATTRARERLVLTGCDKGGRLRDIAGSGLLFGADAISDWQLRSCRSALEWIVCALSDQKTLHSGFATALEDRCDDEGLFSFRVYGQARLEELNEFVQALRKKKRTGKHAAKELKSKGPQSKLLPQIKESLHRRYEFGTAPLLPAKQSVTQLTHRNDEYAKFDYTRAFEARPHALLTDDSIGAVDARLIGTAAHLLISQIDLTGPVTRKAIEQTMEKLLGAAEMTEAVAARINIDSIAAFFESQLGKMMRSPENTIWREWPFSFTIGVSQWRKTQDVKVIGCENESIIVQGIIDVLAETTDGLVIIDFKTDHVTTDQAPARAENYRGQLELYAQAAESILRHKVTGKWLYFLTPGRAISIDSDCRQG